MRETPCTGPCRSMSLSQLRRTHAKTHAYMLHATLYCTTFAVPLHAMTLWHMRAHTITYCYITLHKSKSQESKLQDIPLDRIALHHISYTTYIEIHIICITIHSPTSKSLPSRHKLHRQATSTDMQKCPNGVLLMFCTSFPQHDDPQAAGHVNAKDGASFSALVSLSSLSLLKWSGEPTRFIIDL